MTVLAQARVVTPDAVLDPGWVELAGPGIVGVGRGRRADADVDLGGAWVVPGFVDLHMHGGGGADATKSADEMAAAVAHHRSHGTTSTLVSLMAQPVDAMCEQLGWAARLRDAGEIVGAHLEGPFLAAARCGAQRPESLLPPDIPTLHKLLDAGQGCGADRDGRAGAARSPRPDRRAGRRRCGRRDRAHRCDVRAGHCRLRCRCAPRHAPVQRDGVVQPARARPVRRRARRRGVRRGDQRRRARARRARPPRCPVGAERARVHHRRDQRDRCRGRDVHARRADGAGPRRQRDARRHRTARRQHADDGRRVAPRRSRCSECPSSPPPARRPALPRACWGSPTASARSRPDSMPTWSCSTTRWSRSA